MFRSKMEAKHRIFVHLNIKVGEQKCIYIFEKEKTKQNKTKTKTEIKKNPLKKFCHIAQ